MTANKQLLIGFDVGTKPSETVTSFAYFGKHYQMPHGWNVVPEGELTAFGDKMFDGENFRCLSLMTIAGCPRVLRAEIVIRHPHVFWTLNLKGLPALSINQPWAWCIVRADIAGPVQRKAALAAGLMKPVENREWNERNPGRKFRGRFLVHASKGPDLGPKARREYAVSYASATNMAGSALPIPPIEQIERGGIIGIATVKDFVDDHESEWFCGPDALVLGEEVTPLPFTPCMGMLGFFKPVYPETFTKGPAA
jgi:hypothetical protein